ncbi:hypothetical protein ACJ41O_008744 [Fusarium nematophilum]
MSAAIATDDFDLDHVQPLLKQAIDEADDSAIWDQVKSAVAETTPPPRPIPSSIQQTPWLRNTSSFPNSSEYRKHVDGVLKEELGLMYVGLPKFWDTYFGGMDDLKTASEAFFKQCVKEPSPMFTNGWTGWPTDAREDDVLDWFAGFYETLATFATDGRQAYRANDDRWRSRTSRSMVQWGNGRWTLASSATQQHRRTRSVIGPRIQSMVRASLAEAHRQEQTDRQSLGRPGNLVFGDCAIALDSILSRKIQFNKHAFGPWTD